MATSNVLSYYKPKEGVWVCMGHDKVVVAENSCSDCIRLRVEERLVAERMRLEREIEDVRNRINRLIGGQP